MAKWQRQFKDITELNTKAKFDEVLTDETIPKKKKKQIKKYKQINKGYYQKEQNSRLCKHSEGACRKPRYVTQVLYKCCSPFSTGFAQKMPSSTSPSFSLLIQSCSKKTRCVLNRAMLLSHILCNGHLSQFFQPCYPADMKRKRTVECTEHAL